MKLHGKLHCVTRYKTTKGHQHLTTTTKMPDYGFSLENNSSENTMSNSIKPYRKLHCMTRSVQKYNKASRLTNKNNTKMADFLFLLVRTCSLK